MPSYHKTYTSPGPWPSLHYKYGDVLHILDCLLSTSILLLLTISLVDLARVDTDGDLDLTRLNTKQDLISVIRVTNLLYLLLQVLMFVVSLISYTCPSSNTVFVLTVGVREVAGGSVTRYGSTLEGGQDIVGQDQISVYYHRLGWGWPPFPLSGCTLPGQVVCLLFSLLLFLLHLTRSRTDPLTWVAVLVVVHQTLLLLISLAVSTDTGCWLPGLSVTRQFLHTDFYTELVQNLVVREHGHRTQLEGQAGSEWFRSSVVTEQVAELSDQVRELQGLLEDTHLALYREVFPGEGEQGASSLFLSRAEIRELVRHFVKEEMAGDMGEKVIYRAGPGG